MSMLVAAGTHAYRDGGAGPLLHLRTWVSDEHEPTPDDMHVFGVLAFHVVPDDRRERSICPARAALLLRGFDQFVHIAVFLGE